MPLRWAVRVMHWLPRPLARWWRKRRFEAIRKRDGDGVVFQRIVDALQEEDP
jgi:hypothetical protein